jgi:hypothetical protein
VDPARGGTAELVRLVDGALAAHTTGAVVDPPDARRVLGVGPAATAEDVHGAFRRLSRLVHPDLGGTDELFRVVAAARDELLAPVGTRRRRRRSEWERPAPPPPRAPYRAPPPEERHVVPPWRAVRDLLGSGAVLAMAALVLYAAFTVGRVLGGILVVAIVVWSGTVLRPALEGSLRAVIVLLGTRVHVRDDVAPERFLEATCLDAPVGRQREGELYDAYVRWCGSRPAVARWVFIEQLRTLGLLLVKPSAWADGIWVGIRLR